MEISRDVFAAWRAPRFGTENPTRLDNALWASLVHDRINAYQVNKRFGYERQRGAGPTWCFDRFGQSATPLDDGRTLYIGGEHEDYYDPDFFIYNDAVVVAPDGGVEFFGYPRAVFPPTDFHTSTRDADRVWIVGSLGYADARKPGATQVYRLDLGTMAIEEVATAGDAPGWLHKHEAELVDGALVVRGGLVLHALDASLEENIDEWALDLATLEWTRRTRRDWQRWAARRVDGGRSFLWELRQLKWHVDHPQFGFGGSTRETVAKEIRGEPELALLETLYRYERAEKIEGTEADAFNLWRIELDGVIVRFTEESERVVVIVEGRLTDERLRALQAHVLAGLNALHFTAWELET